MDFTDFTAGKNDEGRRLDRILRIFLSDKSLGDIYKLLRKGLIRLNQKKCKPETHVSSGDIISIASFLLENNDVKNNDIKNNDIKNNDIYGSKKIANHDLNIVFENEHLLIIDKPYGRSVHGNDADSLEQEVTAYYQSTKKEIYDSISFRPGPLHRLDRNTTGLLVFSMSLKGAHWFSEGIKNHTVAKKYYGIAEGKLSECEHWEDYLTDSDETNGGFYTVKQDDNGLLAETVAVPVSYGVYKGNSITLVEYSIKTGRKHQIRAQTSLHSHPLLGDTAYGSKNSLKGKRAFYLQAFELDFPKENPLGLPSKVQIPLSSDFNDILES